MTKPADLDRDAARYLYGLTAAKRFDPAAHGLRRMRRLLELLADPQEDVPAVHIAGTPGKGTVNALITAQLVGHGFRIGSFMSPHVYSLRERFLFDGLPIEAGLLADLVDDVRGAVHIGEQEGRGRPTFFEACTAVAFTAFRGRADYAVVETGLGGLFDATNTLRRPDKLAVLTTIGMDHVEILGPEITDIARQKAGILPTGGGAVSDMQRPEVGRVVAAVAARRDCLLETAYPPQPHPKDSSCAPDHQRRKLAVASRPVEILAARDGWCPDSGARQAALATVHLPGRFQTTTVSGIPVLLDGSHYPLKLSALVADLRAAYPGRRFCWAVAFAADKDVPAALQEISPLVEELVVTEFRSGDDHPQSGPRRPRRLRRLPEA
ncbi:hypothetical protein [Pseudonocardia sp. NPDC049154]|uniref:bifunctional folylpolyglutamate synthase/dihydrofolate synthase n=1 Tax=Pseudonocardia sp. NPDC049154 TaxID=3155501 RepID=UPI0033F8B6ED